MGLAGGADLDGDSTLDLAIGFDCAADPVFEPGAAYIVDGGARGHVSVDGATASIFAVQEGAFFGQSLAIPGDLDGDGFADLVVGSPGYDVGVGQVYVFRGPLTGDRDLAEADAVLLGGDNAPDSGGQLYGGVGNHLAAAGDTDADGLADILVGCSGGLDTFLLRGPIAGTCDLGDCAALRVEQPPEGWSTGGVGSDVASAGDVDGDGLPDLLLGYAPGKVFVVDGSRSGVLGIEDVDMVLTGGESDCVGLGLAGPGDVDGDGYPDLVLGAQCAGQNMGGVYVVRGPLSSDIDLPRTATFLSGEFDEDRAGATVAAAGDVDGDGLADVVVGAANHRDDAGTAYVVLGPMVSTALLAESAVVLRGYGADEAGDTLASAGDVDGDGRDDLLIAGPGDTEAGEFTGAAWLVLAADIL